MVFESLIGQTFGRLTVVEKMPIVFRSRKRAKWRCVCICGGEAITTTNSLRNGTTQSCGCIKKEILRANRVKHMEDKRSKEYNTWCNIKKRCFNENTPKYKRYGARGITVCDRWKDSFINFLEDMGRAPSPHHSIERDDNDGNYEPSNCRWATPKEQANNNSRTVRIQYNGEVKTMKQWAEVYGIDYRTLHSDLKYKGLSIGEAISKRIKTA